MMLQVMGYSIGVGAALAVAGWCLDRAAGLLRLPRRGSWIAVMVLSVLVPGVMIIAADPVATSPAPAVPVVVAPAIPPAVTDVAQPEAEPGAGLAPMSLTIESPPAIPRQPMWKIPAPTDGQLAVAWLLMSLAVALYLCIAYALLRRRAAGWQPGRIHEQDVLISEVTGPALLGVLRPRMVVPRWLQTQPPAAQALVLEHERQHIRARDPLLVLAGWLVVAGLPWSPPLWWQWRRLRQAIELDCDARVMKRGAEATTYAEVLLAVTQRAGSAPAGALAMSEPVHALERRIAALVPDAIRYARLQVAGALLLAMAGAGVALALEAPALPEGVRAGAQVEVPAAPVEPAAATPSADAAAAAPTAQAAGARAPELPVPAAAVPVPPARGPAPTLPAATSTAAGPEPAPFMVRVHSPVLAPRSSSFFVNREPPGPAAVPGDADRARLDRYYTALLESLRAVPGLVVVTDSTPGVPDVPYEITVMLGGESRGVSIEARNLSEGLESSVTFANFDALPSLNLWPRLDAFRDDAPVENPDSDMESFVERLRLTLFAPDESLLGGMLSRLLDARLDTAQRMRALNQLMMADRRQDRFRGNVRPLTYSPDPILFAAATETATSASDPALRQQIWSMLGGAGIPRVDPALLIRPIERALAKETDLRVQLVLVNILTLSPADSRSRSVLESFARGEAGGSYPQVVRMAARRVLDGNEYWNEYLVSRLDDPRVTDAEKLELIRYSNTIGSATSTSSTAVRLKLDEPAERSVASLMRRQGAPELANAAAQLLGSIGGAVARGELITFLRAGTGGPSTADNGLRRSVLALLAYSLPSFPEIRSLFEDVAARDVDPAMREAARQALEFKRGTFSIGRNFP